METKMTYGHLLDCKENFTEILKNLAHVELHALLRQACSTANLPLITYLVHERHIPLTAEDVTTG